MDVGMHFRWLLDGFWLDFGGGWETRSPSDPPLGLQEGPGGAQLGAPRAQIERTGQEFKKEIQKRQIYGLNLRWVGGRGGPPKVDL